MIPASVIDSTDGLPRWRRISAGPESRLLGRFQDRLGLATPAGCRLIFLREPPLQVGFPDLVAVVWHERTAAHWGPDRANLQIGDLQLMQVLRRLGPSSEEDLAAVRTDADLERRLGRLESLGLVRNIKGMWHSAALFRSFAIRRIVAFEAKTSASARVLEQASANRWFASQSYALLPRAPSREFTKQARRLGVGIWLETDPTPALPAAIEEDQPLSIGSWLINEWIWKAQVR